MTQRTKKATAKKSATDAASAPAGKKPRESHKATPETRALVEMALAGGFTQEQVARELGISRRTLSTHYPDECAEGGARATLKVAQNLYTMATQTLDPKTALTASIFWLKARAGWRDGSGVNATAKAGDGVVEFTLKIGERDSDSA
jgi:transcriptional regulator with XRE-family HTH domain